VVHPRSRVLLGVLQAAVRGHAAAGAEGVDDLSAVASAAAAHIAVALASALGPLSASPLPPEPRPRFSLHGDRPPAVPAEPARVAGE